MKLTKIQKRFIELDRHKETVKKFFDEYNAAVEAVIEEFNKAQSCGSIKVVGHSFTDEEGVIYETTIPKGRFVYYEQFAIIHTKRNGETKGSLSQKRASEFKGSVKIKSKKKVKK